MLDRIRGWEEHFQALEREWKEIQQQNMEDVMAFWERAMMEVNRDYRDLVSRGMWVSGPADFLSIINRAHDERTHSRMLAWLLTPTGRHGLRNMLLMRLLEYYDLNHSRGGNTHLPQVRGIVRSVECLKKLQNDREADIVVWGEDFTLVIEMKVNAGESSTQCDDLYEIFCAEPGSRFLFLTRNGDKPETAKTRGAKEAFEAISWPKVRGMVEDALSHPVSRQGAAVSVVENYVITLKEQLDG